MLEWCETVKSVSIRYIILNFTHDSIGDPTFFICGSEDGSRYEGEFHEDKASSAAGFGERAQVLPRESMALGTVSILSCGTSNEWTYIIVL